MPRPSLLNASPRLRASRRASMALAGVIALLARPPALADMRVWTSTRGTTLEAELLRVEGEDVILRQTDGRHARIPVSRLSAVDREYLARPSRPATGEAASPAAGMPLGPTLYPTWARPSRAKVPLDKPWQATSSSPESSAGMRRSVGVLRYQIAQTPPDVNMPFMRLQLVRHLTDLDLHALALSEAEALLQLPPDTAYNPRVYAYPALADVQADARRFQGRILARTGAAQASHDAVAPLSPHTGYDHVREAERLALLDDHDGALAQLARTKGDGHPDRGFSDPFIRLRAATLARALDETEKMRAMARPILARGQTSQKWPQWQSAWAILQCLEENAGRRPTLRPIADLRDGTYAGECRGFDGPIKVSIKVSQGRLADVTVTREAESRPWSALDIIPRRINARNALTVDAVTGATVTSCAVIAAVDQALTRAAP